LTIAIVVRVNRGAGTNFSPTVSNLIHLADELKQRDDEFAYTDAPSLVNIPQSLIAVRQLLHEGDARPSRAAPPSTTLAPEDFLLIRSHRPDDGWLIVEHLPNPPDGYTRFRLRMP
jgi:hypothetical protein